MGGLIPNSVKKEVIELWKQGYSRDETTLKIGISEGSVSNVINEWKKFMGIKAAKYKQAREKALTKRRMRMMTRERRNAKPIEKDTIVKNILDAANSIMNDSLKKKFEVKTQTLKNPDIVDQLLHRMDLRIERIETRLERIQWLIEREAGTIPPMMFGAPEPNPRRVKLKDSVEAALKVDSKDVLKGPNANQHADFVRKNIATIFKSMVPKEILDTLPKNTQKAYYNLLGIMAPPGDPIYDDEEPKADPHEPITDRAARHWNQVAEGVKKIDDLDKSVTQYPPNVKLDLPNKESVDIPGDCSGCGKPIYPSDLITAKPKEDRLYHEACFKDAKD